MQYGTLTAHETTAIALPSLGWNSPPMMLSPGQHPQQACVFNARGESSRQGSREPCGVATSSCVGCTESQGSQGSINAVQRDRLEKEIALLRQPLLQQAVMQSYSDMLQGKSPGFRLLKGAPFAFTKCGCSV